MKNSLLKLLFCFVLAVQLSGCGTSVTRPSTPIKKVAVISLVINSEDLDQYDPVKTATTEKIVNSKFVSGLVKATEAKLSGIMQVRPVSGFVGSADYQGIGVKRQPPYTLPEIDGKSMVLLSAVRQEQVKGKLKPEIAQKLCASLGVDGVVLIYSEWFQERGGMVPTIRPYTDNFVAVWDSHGNLVLRKRIAEMGDVQGFGMVNISAEKLPEWTGLYMKFLDVLVKEMQKLTGSAI